MSVGTKLSAGFLALIVLFGGLLIFYHRVLDRSVETGTELAEVDSRILLASSSQLDLLDRMDEDVAKYRVYGRAEGQEYMLDYRAARVALRDTLRALGGLDLRGGQREALADAAREWAAFEARFVGDRSAEEEARFFASAPEALYAEFLSALEGLRTRTRGLRLVSKAEVTTKIREISRGVEEAARTGWLAIGVALILGGTIAILIVRSIAGPLREIEAGAGAIARGEFDARVEPRGGMELASLGASFNEMAERLGELDRTKRDFLAKVSHDLKTPLASIRETKKVLLDRIPGELNAKQARLLELGLANAERLSEMISKLLELSRLEAGIEDYDFGPVELAGLCERTVERLGPGPAGRGARVIAEGGPATVRGDRGALERVLENLLDNARGHAGDSQVEVRVGIEGSGDGARRAVVSVRDHGPGVPPGDRERIFRSFASGNGNLGSGHVGLGLAICREIVTAHDGLIWVDDAPGGGSVFAFALPAIESAGGTEGETTVQHETPGRA